MTQRVNVKVFYQLLYSIALRTHSLSPSIGLQPNCIHLVSKFVGNLLQLLDRHEGNSLQRLIVFCWWLSWWRGWEISWEISWEIWLSMIFRRICYFNVETSCFQIKTTNLYSQEKILSKFKLHCTTHVKLKHNP